MHMHVLAMYLRAVRQHRRGLLTTPSRAPTQDRGQSVSHRTPLRAIAKRVTARLTALDDWIFADDDLAAAARDWQVSRPRLLTRTYRDSRWDQVDLEPIPPSAGRVR
jgi:hypothetical protein